MITKTVLLLLVPWLVLCTIGEGYRFPFKGFAGPKRSHPANRARAKGDIVDECSNHMDPYLWGQPKTEVNLNPCIYYHCEGKRYVERRCPDGTSVTMGFQKKWTKLHRGHKKNPCNARNRRCKRSMTEKGLGN